MSRAPKNVVAITPGGNITLDHIMGFYTLFTIPDKPVSTTKLNRLWIAEGLPHDLIPHERDAKHNFMHAVRSIETRSRSTDKENRRKDVEVDPVTETSDYVVYQVTSLIRDRLNEVIDHPKAMRIRYDKATEAITPERLDRNTGLDDAELETLATRVQDQFDANASKVPGARVRASVRALMKDIGATNVRKKAGGVYFVPKDGKSTLDGLGSVLRGLWGDDEAELHLIVAANAEGERALVEKHFTVNLSDEVDELMAEVTEALVAADPKTATDPRKMRKDRFGNIVNRRKAMAEQRERYSELLGSTLEEVETKLELLDAQLEKLVLNLNVD
jgi:hypothetical protein